MSGDVWLEIADAKAEGAGSGSTLELRWRVNTTSGRARLQLGSPFTPSMAELVRSYVRRYCSWRASERDWALTAERTMLTLGRALGSALVDPDYSLLSFCECLEREKNIGTLRVAVLSDEPAVTAVPWELMILPDSMYVVAAAASAFVRAPRSSQPFVEPVRALELGTEPERVLRYLRLDGCASRPGLLLDDMWKGLALDGAIHIGLGPSPSWRSALPEANEHGWHIIHWTGEARREGAEQHLQLRDAHGAEHSIPAERFFAAALAQRAELLILEPTEGNELAADLAAAALRAGIPNVLLIAEPSRCGWPSRWLEHFFDCLADGLGLQQAVVETRKRLQRTLLDARQAQLEQPHAPMFGHVLQHYSACDVVFFKTPHARVPFDQSAAYRALRAQLYGFERRALPPQAPALGDAPTLALFEALTIKGAALAFAAEGGGLTHTLHRCAYLLLATNSAARGYYWDCARERYSARDILEMVAGTCGVTDPAQVSEQGVLAEIAARPALFVFDNVDVLLRESPVALEELLSLVGRIHAAGGLCLVGTHTQLPQSALPVVALPAMSELDCVTVASAHQLDLRVLGPKFFQLAEQLDGSPLLVQRVLTDCSASTLDERLREASTYFGATCEAAQRVQQFFAYRFEQLDPCWQHLLCAWAPLRGLYLQLLMIAVDRSAREPGDPSQSGSELWRVLGVPEGTSCASAIAHLKRAGFAIEESAGVCLDAAALRFLATREPAPQATRNTLAIAVCDGVLQLLTRRGSAVPDVLRGHLLEHRAVLREQVEAVFATGEHVLATRTFLSLSTLLQQAQLGHESGAWAASLLDSPGAAWRETDDARVETAWLSIALRVPVVQHRALLEDGADHWKKALLHGASASDPSKRAMLPLAVQFLERFYDQTGDVASYRDVAHAAAEYYLDSKDKSLRVEQLVALAAAEHVLGHSDERDRLEHALLHGTDYGEGPASIALRRATLARLVRMRLARGDDQAGETIITLLEDERTEASLDPIALHCRGDLALSRQQWERAAEHFCILWRAALQGTKAVDIDTTAHRLAQLQDKLGLQHFSAIYAQFAGEDTPTPETLGIQARAF